MHQTSYTLPGSLFQHNKLLFSLHTRCSFPGMGYPSSCFMYNSSSKLPCKKAILRSIWNNSKSKATVRANKTRSVVSVTTGEKTSWKTMPSFWAYRLAPGLALYFASYDVSIFLPNDPHYPAMDLHQEVH